MGVLKWLFGTTIALKIADILTTYHAVIKYGAEAEFNPFMRGMIITYGLDWACFISMLIYSMLMFLLYKYRRKNLLMIAIALMSLVVMANVINMLIGV